MSESRQNADLGLDVQQAGKNYEQQLRPLCLANRYVAVRNRTWGGDQELARSCNIYASALKDKINREAYDAENGLYRDIMGNKNRYSLDASALAVLFGISDSVANVKILENMSDKFGTPYGALLYCPKEVPDGQNYVHNDHIWPFVNILFLEALLKNGEAEKVLLLLDSVWGNMLRRGTDTFWEIVDGYTGGFMTKRLNNPPDDRDTWNSECHGWSGGLPYLFFTYFAGVHCCSYGYKTVLFSPLDVGLNWLEASVPIANGAIWVRIQKKDGKRQATIVCREEIQVLFDPDRVTRAEKILVENGYSTYQADLMENGFKETNRLHKTFAV